MDDEEPWVLEERGDEGGALLVRLVLSVKGVRTVERVVDSGAEHGPATVRLIRGDLVAEGALAAIALLEEEHPTPPLLPADANGRARARQLIELALPALRDGRAGTIEPALLGLERALSSASPGGPRGAFAVGSHLSLGGLAIAATSMLAERRGIDLEPLQEVLRVHLSLGRIPAISRVRVMGSGRGVVDDLRPEQRDGVLALVAERVVPLAESIRLLSRIAWPRALEEEFFARGAWSLPEPEYEIDRPAANAAIRELRAILPQLSGDHVLLRWLHEITSSCIDGYRMVLAVGTPSFHRLSVEQYGGARTTAFDGDTTNLDLAEYLARRVSPSASLVDTQELDTDAFVALLQRRLGARSPRLEVSIVRDPALSAKVICGRNRVRVREGARFSRAEAEGLYLHEIETHALTAQNGHAQARLPMLRIGGPRTTRTQEGLAVFSELYGRVLSTPRLMRLVERVRLVAMAEDGASFVELYRHLVARGMPPRDAYLDAQRVCRGGLVEGRGPFTKDASYLAGLVDVHAYLARTLRYRSPLIGELLVAGRVALEDSLALVWLRRQGLVEPPRYVPGWAQDWDSLLAYFAFASFLPSIQSSAQPSLPAEIEAFIARAIADNAPPPAPPPTPSPTAHAPPS